MRVEIWYLFERLNLSQNNLRSDNEMRFGIRPSLVKSITIHAITDRWRP